MAIAMHDLLRAGARRLRFEPLHRRLRAVLEDSIACDSMDAILVWEPRRLVPQYGVPLRDLAVELLPATSGSGSVDPGDPILTPADPFIVHTTDGEPLTVQTAGVRREGAAFRPTDPELNEYAVLDFAAFDKWLEEDDPVVAHPRDPFHRVDVRRSSRHVRIELDGFVLAESRRFTLVVETGLPVRYYLPAEDVAADRIAPSDTTSLCAYKGRATYRSISLPHRTVADLVWTYPEPLKDVPGIAGQFCFFGERVDTFIDGVRVNRPGGPWA